MANRLTDGLPISTEWLNTLVDEINSLQGITASSATSPSRKINVYGTGFTGSSRTVQVIADQWSGTAPSGVTTLDATVNFPTPFADNNIIVVATPSFLSASGRNNKPFRSYAMVGGITTSKFELAVDLTEAEADLGTGRNVLVNYIAIGKAP